MASVPVNGLEEVDSSENEGSSGGVLGKPSPASFVRVFAGSTTAEVRDAFDAAVSSAKDAGWRVDFVTPSGNGVIAEREIEGQRAQLTISLNENPDLGPAPGLWISLRTTVE